MAHKDDLPPHPEAPVSQTQEAATGIRKWEKARISSAFETAALSSEAKPAGMLTKDQEMWQRFAAEPASAGKVAGIVLDLIKTFTMATVGQLIYDKPYLDAYFERPVSIGDGDTGDRTMASAAEHATSGAAFRDMLKDMPGPG